jgi:hypothetical protein
MKGFFCLNQDFQDKIKTVFGEFSFYLEILTIREILIQTKVQRMTEDKRIGSLI